MSQVGQYLISVAPAAGVLTITGSGGGGPISPLLGNINLNGTFPIAITGTPLTSTLSVSVATATTTQLGVVELATNAQAIAGTDTANALTASNLAAKLGTQTNYGLPLGRGTSNAFSWSAAPTNGQILIGNSGTTSALATITGGPGITVTNGAGSITISATGGGLAWSREAATPVAMAVNHGYIQANGTPATLTTFTLPATAAIGTEIEILGENSGGWTIAQNAGQNIQYGNVSTMVGAGGSLSSSNRYDAVTIVCRVADTTWSVVSVVGVLNAV